MRLAFTLEYDGTDFSGFQLQKNAITIQEHLEKAIKEITATDIKINYSGRTDAGVHAISQVFDFETEIQRDDSSWIRGINSNLPKSIAVKNIFHVPIKKVTFVDMKTIDNFIIVTIAANAFLQNMVRIMVGTLIDIAKQENKLSVMDILKKENRSYAGKTLPASGLFFLGPTYKENLKIESLEHNLFDRLKI